MDFKKAVISDVVGCLTDGCAVFVVVDGDGAAEDLEFDSLVLDLVGGVGFSLGAVASDDGFGEDFVVCDDGFAAGRTDVEEILD
jgi:hypothetical protein